MNKLSLLFFILLTAGCTQNSKCGIESCHGLDITCGANVPDVCTALYQLGDFCRSYINCSTVNGDCILNVNTQFIECKNCVNYCETEFDGADTFTCESTCRERMDKYCNDDIDCACGRNKFTGDCFFGSKDLVNTDSQCPDYCSGIAGNLEIRCIQKECKQVTIS